MAATRVFRVDIHARRAVVRVVATARFMVKSVNKDGSISRATPTRDKWLHGAFATIEGGAPPLRP